MVATTIRLNKKPVFKLGDRVRCLEPHDSKTNIVGKLGTILSLGNTDYPCVQFDKSIGGHDGDRKGKKGHCWNINSFKLEKIETSWKARLQ